MHTAIIIDETGIQSAVQDTAQLLHDVTMFADIIVVSRNERPQSLTFGAWITAESLVEGFRRAVTSAASKRVLVVNSALAFSFTDLSKLVSEIERCSPLEHVIVAPMTSEGTLEVPEMTPESITQSLSRYDSWPLMCVSTSRYALNNTSNDSAQSVNETLVQALIRSSADGDTIKLSSVIAPQANAGTAQTSSLLSQEARARCLRVASDTMNIEEMYPQHNWTTYSQESAAAAYHSLAALFLSLGDAEAAAECLSCSEQLEESPRYFALQGLIQQAQGETLGAVANLVSSLQCYESRKSNDGKHYLSFQPGNVEALKTRLAEGLEALNKRDNARALQSFSEAVFNFDSFYAEHGVTGSRKERN